jgi:two-component system chemotaxis response regulator CheY
MRKIVIKALNEAGHSEIVEAGNGQDALSKIQDIDIVFTDWNMPVMDGLTFVREVRKTSKVPIVMITTEGGQKEVLEAMKSGVNDYIVKPFTPTVLLTKLESAIKKAKK